MRPKITGVKSDIGQQKTFIDCMCKKFLVVDDNELNRFVLKGLLKKIKFESEEVAFLYR